MDIKTRVDLTEIVAEALWSSRYPFCPWARCGEWERGQFRDQAKSAVNAIVDRLDNPAKPMRLNLGQLSPRQREVALFMAEGHTNKWIASKLDISPRTVEIHVAAVLEEFGVSRGRFIYAMAKWGYYE